jgi:hypothetical protein
MAETPELQTEHVQEHMQEHAHHSGSGFVSAVALSTALIAALAAVTASLAGHHANEATLKQIESADLWSQYQAKSIKASVLETRIAVLEAVGKEPPEKDRKKLEEYRTVDQKEIEEKARETQAESKEHLHRHQVLSRGVTLYQIAIAVAAISALTRRKAFWFVALGAGAVATVFLVQGIM